MSSPKPSDRAICAALLLDLLELVEADLVEILRVERERRPRQDLGAIEGVAVGRRPEAGLFAAGVAVLAAQLVEIGLIGRIDDLADDPLDLGALFGRGDLGVRDDDRLVGRDGQDALELRDRPLGDDPRRGQAAPEPLAQELAVRRHVALVVAQAGSELVEPLGRVGLLERGEDRQDLLRSLELVDDLEAVDPLVVLDDVELADHADHVERDLLLEREAGLRDRARLGLGGLHQPARLRATLGTGVRQAVVVALVAVDRRRRRRQLEDPLPEPVGERVDGGGRGVGHRALLGRAGSGGSVRQAGQRTASCVAMNQLAVVASGRERRRRPPRPSVAAPWGSPRSAGGREERDLEAAGLDRCVEAEVGLEVVDVRACRARRTRAGGST